MINKIKSIRSTERFQDTFSWYCVDLIKINNLSIEGNSVISHWEVNHLSLFRDHGSCKGFETQLLPLLGRLEPHAYQNHTENRCKFAVFLLPRLVQCHGRWPTPLPPSVSCRLLHFPDSSAPFLPKIYNLKASGKRNCAIIRSRIKPLVVWLHCYKFFRRQFTVIAIEMRKVSPLL